MGPNHDREEQNVRSSSETSRLQITTLWRHTSKPQPWDFRMRESTNPRFLQQTKRRLQGTLGGIQQGLIHRPIVVGLHLDDLTLKQHPLVVPTVSFSRPTKIHPFLVRSVPRSFLWLQERVALIQIPQSCPACPEMQVDTGYDKPQFDSINRATAERLNCTAKVWDCWTSFGSTG